MIIIIYFAIISDLMLRRFVMRIKYLEPIFYTECPKVCTKPGCGGTAFLQHEEGWQCFNCMKVIHKANERNKIYVKRYSRNNQGGIMRFKNLIKYILFPVYRRSVQIGKYIEHGYSQQEALAKVKVIEVQQYNSKVFIDLFSLLEELA